MISLLLAAFLASSNNAASCKYFLSSGFAVPLDVCSSASVDGDAKESTMYKCMGGTGNYSVDMQEFATSDCTGDSEDMTVDSDCEGADGTDDCYCDASSTCPTLEERGEDRTCTAADGCVCSSTKYDLTYYLSNTCIKTGTATSYKIYCSGSTGTYTQYTDATCGTAEAEDTPNPTSPSAPTPTYANWAVSCYTYGCSAAGRIETFGILSFALMIIANLF